MKNHFSIVSFESRKNLLAISTENFDFCEIRESEVDYSIIKNAYRIFTDTFSEEIIKPPVCVSSKKVGCLYFISTQFFATTKYIVLCFFLCLQEVKRVSLGSLMPFEKQINNIFRIEKA